MNWAHNDGIFTVMKDGVVVAKGTWTEVMSVVKNWN